MILSKNFKEIGLSRIYHKYPITKIIKWDYYYNKTNNNLLPSLWFLGEDWFDDVDLEDYFLQYKVVFI